MKNFSVLFYVPFIKANYAKAFKSNCMTKIIKMIWCLESLFLLCKTLICFFTACLSLLCKLFVRSYKKIYNPQLPKKILEELFSMRDLT